MKRFMIVASVLFLSACIFGCNKREIISELPQEPLSMDALSAQGASSQPVSADSPSSFEQAQAVSQPAGLESLPPAGPYKPSISEIQTALKNAGYYTGSIDGKTGPLTKKATVAFQKAKGLEADGKVGPRTWSALSQYLDSAAAGSVPSDKPGIKTR